MYFLSSVSPTQLLEGCAFPGRSHCSLLCDSVTQDHLVIESELSGIQQSPGNFFDADLLLSGAGIEIFHHRFHFGLGWLPCQISQVQVSCCSCRVFRFQHSLGDIAGRRLHPADHRSADCIRADFRKVPFARYAPVRRQLLNILRAVNEKRQQAGYTTLPPSSVGLRRKIEKPFDGPV